MMAKFDFSDEVIDRTINPDDGENGLEQGQPSSDTSVEAIYVDGVEAVIRTSISNKPGYYVLFPRSKDLSEIQASDLEVKTPSNANSTITDIEIEYKTVSGILPNVNLKFTVVAEDQVTTEDYIVYLRYLVEEEEDSLQSGQYILVDTNNQVPGVLDGTWVTREDAAEDPRTSIMILEIEGDQVKIKDSNGKYIAPKGGNNNGIKEGEYSWLLVDNEDGTYSFKGQGNDTVEFANNKCATGYRAYKQSTVNGSPNSYPSDFKLYKVD